MVEVTQLGLPPLGAHGEQKQQVTEPNTDRSPLNRFWKFALVLRRPPRHPLARISSHIAVL